MIPLYITAGMFLVAGLVMELYAVIRAPLGYQDETGFHPGVKPQGSDEAGPDSNLS